MKKILPLILLLILSSCGDDDDSGCVNPSVSTQSLVQSDAQSGGVSGVFYTGEAGFFKDDRFENLAVSKLVPYHGAFQSLGCSGRESVVGKDFFEERRLTTYLKIEEQTFQQIEIVEYYRDDHFLGSSCSQIEGQVEKESVVTYLRSEQGLIASVYMAGGTWVLESL